MADDLAKWLAAARPNTAADDGWSTSPEGDRTLAAIHRTVNQRTAYRPRRRRVWATAQGVGLVAATAFLVAGLPAPIGTDSTVPAPTRPPVPAHMALVAYSSCASMLAGLRAHTAANVGPWGLPAVSGYPYSDARGKSLDPRPADGAAAAQPAPEHSGTNVQEAGVDEPDIVKTDGNRIVTVSGGVLRVVDTTARKITGTLKLPGGPQWQPADLFVSGDRALVLSHPGYGNASGGGLTLGPAGVRPPGDSSRYLLVDLSGRPHVLGSITPTGGYVDARMVGSTVRLVIRSGPGIAFPLPTPASARLTDLQRTARNKVLVQKAPLSAWLPSYDVSAAGVTRTETVPCGQVSHPSAYTGMSMLTIYTIDLSQGLRDTAPVSLAADGDTVYGTASSLYIASNPRWWACCVPRLAADQRPGSAPKAPAEQTELHRFDITGPGRPRYLGSGSVPGRLLNQYSLSDYDRHLRIATTASDGRTTSASAVYVLDANTLAVTGHVGGLGKGERIYAVRFAGPIGYVVTFRQVDPLYVLDLHDATAPREAGELKITGYSSYLHPAGDGRLIGVGQEADTHGIVSGLQVSLFDVSIASKPRRLAQVIRKDAVDEGQLDPHAFLYWPATGVVVVPIQSWNRAVSGKALVLKVSADGLASVGLISHPVPAGGVPPYPYSQGIQRTMVIGADIWTLSSAGFKVSTMATLADQAWIAFS